MEHLISLHDLTVEDFESIFKLAEKLKRQQKKVYLTTCSKAKLLV